MCKTTLVKNCHTPVCAANCAFLPIPPLFSEFLSISFLKTAGKLARELTMTNVIIHLIGIVKKKNSQRKKERSPHPMYTSHPTTSMSIANAMESQVHSHIPLNFAELAHSHGQATATKCKPWKHHKHSKGQPHNHPLSLFIVDGDD